MSRKVITALTGTAAALLLLLAAAVSGVAQLPGSASTSRPPCRALPSSDEVQAALTAHTDVIRGLTAVAPGVRVSVDRPCDGDLAQRGLLRITTRNGRGAAAVSDWLKTHDGFGVPLQVE